MATKAVLTTMPKEILCMIFAHVYSLSVVDFTICGRRSHHMGRDHAKDLRSWVLEKDISPMLICKLLRPIAADAFLGTVVFIVGMYGRSNPENSGWWDMDNLSSQACDPILLARRVQCNIQWAVSLYNHRAPKKYPVPRLRELTIEDTIYFGAVKRNTVKKFDKNLSSLNNLSIWCQKMGILFEANITFTCYDCKCNRRHNDDFVCLGKEQLVALTIHQDQTVTLRRVEDTHYTFYEMVRQYIARAMQGFMMPEFKLASGDQLINFPNQSVKTPLPVTL